MARYDKNYQLVVDWKSARRELDKRYDDDRKIALLDPYIMKQLDGQQTPDVINVTMNEAMVFANRCAAIMNGANMHRIIQGRNLNDTDTTNLEEFYLDIYYMNDLALANVVYTSLYGFHIEQILLRGAIAGRILMRWDGDRFIPEIMPFDVRYFYSESDSQGIIGGGYETTRTKAQIERDYGIVYRGPSAVVTDFWDDRVNEIYIGSKKYEGGSQTNDSKRYPAREAEHGLGYPPLVFQKSGAGISSLMDVGNMKYQGESIFAPNRGLYPELHRAASIMQTLTAMSFEGSYQYESEEGTEADRPQSPFNGIRKLIPVEKGGGFKLIPINDVKNATRLFYNMLVGALQRGGLSNIDYGALTFPLSAVAIKNLQGQKDAIFIPRLNAMALWYRAASQMIKKQYVQVGGSAEIGEEGFEKEYPAADIDKKFSTKYEFHSTSPMLDIANTAVAQQQLALGISRHTIYSETLKMNDPEGEINKSREEKAEAGDIAITLLKRLRSLADRDGNFDKKSGKDIEAEMILQQLEMTLKQRAVGNPMGLDPQKGGIGGGQSMKPMIPLMDKGGNSLRSNREEGAEEVREPAEDDMRSQRREEVVSRSRSEV